MVDLAEEADHVSVLHEGMLLHTGGVASFLAHAPFGTPDGRAAEAAYDSLLSAYDTAMP